jgi:hypothetical protein
MCGRRRFRAVWLPAVPAIVIASLIGAAVGQATDGGRPTTADHQDDPPPESIGAAVKRALPLLVAASAVVYPKKRDCFSCHNQAVPAVALSHAKVRGFDVDNQTLHAIAEHTEADLSSALDDYRQGKGQPGGVIRAGYALWALEAAGWKPDETTTAVSHYLAGGSGGRDPWTTRSNRPPSESSAFTATALALRGLDNFGTAASGPVKAESKGKLPGQSQPKTEGPWRARALRWLTATNPRETEDRVFRLVGLKYAGATKEVLAAAVADLVKAQRPDGGWSQLDAPIAESKPDKGPNSTRHTDMTGLASDPYATGSVLVALHQAGGMATADPAYRRGLGFLVRTQRADGSWYVKSRSHPFQTYFESGFPHGPDQFISAAASGWAVAALALACPKG